MSTIRCAKRSRRASSCPGQKLSFRFVAGALGVSLTPVREALRRLVAEGAFEMQPNRSVRVPLMTQTAVPRVARHPHGGRGAGGRKAATLAKREQIAGAADRPRTLWRRAPAATA